MSGFAAPLLLALLLAVQVKAQNQSTENGGTEPSDIGGAQTGSAGGASGPEQGSYNLSRGGEIAIIVVVTVFAGFGIVSAILWYVAKKRQWEVRKTIKRASRRVSQKITGRQSRQDPRRRGLVRLEDSPKHTQTRERDLEKGEATKKKLVPTERMVVDDSKQSKSSTDTSKTGASKGWTSADRR